jgi:hypothetical protein
MVTGEGRSDVLLAAGVVALLVARFRWAGGDGDLEPSFLIALAVSVALCAAAVVSSRGLSGAVRALMASIAFFTFALDPTTGWDQRNFAYGVPGTVFATAALVWVNRHLRAGRMRSPAPTGERVVATASWMTAALMLAAVAVFVAVNIVVLWALSSGG